MAAENNKKDALDRVCQLVENLIKQTQDDVSAPSSRQQATAAISAILVALFLATERKKQNNNTLPPLVFYDKTKHATMKGNLATIIYQKLTANTDSVFNKLIRPSYLIGNNTALSSAAAYLNPGPKMRHVNFREVLTMPVDGASILLEWELPAKLHTVDMSDSNRHSSQSIVTDSHKQRRIILSDSTAPANTGTKIDQPLIFILHGLNNHANFGYVKSLRHFIAKNGWIAVAMNQRGLQGAPLTTPRVSNAAYTGDIRYTILQLARRLSSTAPMIVVGASLGGNSIAKYLGEEGLSNTLPKCIIGGITLGSIVNLEALAQHPIMKASANGAFRLQLLNQLLLSKYVFQRSNTKGSKAYSSVNEKSMVQINDLDQAYVEALLKSNSPNAYDNTLAPYLIANDKYYPYTTRTGYHHTNNDKTIQHFANAESSKTNSAEELTPAEIFRRDASADVLLPYISIPLLQAYSGDDLVVAEPMRAALPYALSNPNIITVETKCGGHLGWQQSNGTYSSCWADNVTVDFIKALLEAKQEQQSSTASVDGAVNDSHAIFAHKVAMNEAERLVSRL